MDNILMVNLLTPLLLLALIGCSAGSRLDPQRFDKTLVQHSRELSNISPVKFRLNYGIDFVDSLPSTQVGRCLFINNKGYQIEILKSWYDNSTRLEQDALLLHEIMHCELGIGHVLPNIRPYAKLMATHIQSSIACLELKGHGECILEAVYMFETGEIDSPFSSSHKH